MTTIKTIALAAFIAALPLVANASKDCPCIKNADDKCMTFGKVAYPYRQMDEGISGPHCTSGCYPGFNDVYGWSEATKKELHNCYIDWKRLRHEMGRDHDPQWQW